MIRLTLDCNSGSPASCHSNGTALDLAVRLKEGCANMSSENECAECAACLDSAITALLEARKKGGLMQLPHTRVLQDTVSTWSSLLFNKSFSDCRFTFTSDPAAPPVFAHRNILAAGSPYFQAMLRQDGSWIRSGDGTLSTIHTPEVLKAVLAFIYCGKLDEALLDQETEAIFAAGAEFQLKGLQASAISIPYRMMSYVA